MDVFASDINFVHRIGEVLNRARPRWFLLSLAAQIQKLLVDSQLYVSLKVKVVILWFYFLSAYKMDFTLAINFSISLRVYVFLCLNYLIRFQLLSLIWTTRLICTHECILLYATYMIYILLTGLMKITVLSVNEEEEKHSLLDVNMMQ